MKCHFTYASILLPYVSSNATYLLNNQHIPIQIMTLRPYNKLHLTLKFSCYYILHSHITFTYSQQVQISSKVETVFHLFCAFICQPVPFRTRQRSKAPRLLTLGDCREMRNTKSKESMYEVTIA